MRIAIDGQFRLLPPSGTGAYLEALLRELPSVAPGDEFTVVEPDQEPDPGLVSRIVPARLRRDARWRRFRWETVGFRARASPLSPDLLHVPSFAAPLRSAIPLVVTIHDVIPFVLPEYRASRVMRTHLALMRRTTRKATLVLTPSQAAANDLVTVLGMSSERIRITPEAADPRFRPSGDGRLDASVATRLGIDGPYIFNVAGFDARKRLDLLIEAFAAVRSDLPAGTKLVIGGKPHSSNATVYPPVEPLIAGLGLRDAVVLTGWLDDATKLALYQGATVYVTPSIYEGFGLTPLEAMACGAPVIVADRTSLPEVVGDAGLLVEPTVDPLAEAIQRVVNDPALRDDLSARGLERASRFTWRRTAELTVAAYREAVERA